MMESDAGFAAMEDRISPGSFFQYSLPGFCASPNRSPCPPTDRDRLRLPKPDWYEELFAWLMDTWMESYEKEISGYKMKLFDNLVGKAEKVLEIGIGTGPNFKYYNAIPNVSVLGVDPNPKMECYARNSALEAGLKSQDFQFIHAVAESIPLEDAKGFWFLHSDRPMGNRFFWLEFLRRWCFYRQSTEHRIKNYIRHTSS